MKTLKTISHPDYPTANIEILKREAARVILIDENAMTPMMYSKKYDVYKIPGGGIDVGETPEIAAKREAQEEVGCSCEILGSIGKICDNRPAHIYKKGVNLSQTSYCFYGKILEKGNTSHTESEKEREFELVWLKASEVLGKFDSCKPGVEREAISMKRDRKIFEEYLRINIAA